MKKYVPITLDNYVNESKSVTLKRGYKNNGPVVVGTNAPIRNQVLSFISENKKVLSKTLKKFVAGLNEANSNPNAAATMWIRRNGHYFLTEERAGRTFYKLSPIGRRLVNTFGDAPLTEARKKNNSISEKKKYDFKDPKTDKPGITDEKDEDIKDVKTKKAKKGKKAKVEEECSKDDKLSESRRARIEGLIENIKSKRTSKLNEEDEEEDKKPEEGEDDLTFDDLDLSGEGGEEKTEGDDDGEEGPGEKADGEETEGEESEETEGEESEEDDDDSEKVEITEFIITVDDVDSALEELKEKEVEASKVVDPDGEAEEGEEAYKENEISVAVDDWEALKVWLEDKGIDVEEMFGGEIEIEEPEEGEEDGEGDGEGDDDLELDQDAGDEKIEGEEGEEDFDLDMGDDDLELGDEKEEVEESLVGDLINNAGSKIEKFFGGYSDPKFIEWAQKMGPQYVKMGAISVDDLTAAKNANFDPEEEDAQAFLKQMSLIKGRLTSRKK